MKITKETKIAIGVPRGKEGFDWAWIQCLLKMLSKYPASYVFISEQAPHASARNRITKRFLETKADYLLWIDSDTIWEPDHIQFLMDVDEDMVTGIQFTTSENHLPLIRDIDVKYGVTRPYSKLPSSGEPFEIGGCGFGFILMKRKVVETLKEPWFEFRSGFSEDLNFCLRAKRAGFKILAQPKVLVGHIGEKVYGLQDFLAIPESMRDVFVQSAMVNTNAYLRKTFPNWREDLGFDELAGKVKDLGENLNLKDGYWDDVYSRELSDDFNWRNYPGKFPFISKELLSELPEKAKILELGAGTGLLGKKIREDHPEFILEGIDISKVAVKELKKYFDFFVRGVLPEALSTYVDESQDCVIGCELLEHLDEEPRKRVVQETYRILKDGGLAIFTLPNNIMPPEELAEHRVCYTKNTFEKFLNDAFKGQVNVYEKNCLVSDVPRKDGTKWAEAPFLFGICVKK